MYMLYMYIDKLIVKGWEGGKSETSLSLYRGIEMGKYRFSEQFQLSQLSTFRK